jgi:hypothetical protein
VKKLFVFLGFAVCGLLACRALVGIDDLQLVPDGGDHHENKQNGNDSGGQQQPNDAGNPPPNIDVDATIRGCAGADCPKCCKNAFTALRSNFEDPSGSGHTCMCNPSICGNKCSTLGQACSARQDPPSGTLDECVQCFDTELMNPSSPCAGTCAPTDQGCKDGLRCLESCHP